MDVFFLVRGGQRRSTRTHTLFPYTTLFRSLFSTRSTLPDRPTIARAAASSPPTLAVIAPLLRIVATSLPASIRIAVATSPAASPPVVASILPETRISGTLAPAPIRIAVAEASFEIALNAPPNRTPPEITTAPPTPPLWSPASSLPAENPPHPT